ncbi:MAG: ABC transporter permease [Acidobacteriaceae bacterium]
MIFRRLVRSSLVPLAILRAAAFIVPAYQRVAWYSEWKAELWHVWHTCNCDDHGSSHGQQEAIAFCLGAFKDAWWLRQNQLHRDKLKSTVSSVLASPSQCVFFLAATVAASILLAWYLPGARKAILPSPYADSQSLVMISPSGHTSAPFPTIPLADYRSWQGSASSPFTGIAFYRPMLERVGIAKDQKPEMSIALASDNLFELLQLPGESGISNFTNREHSPGLVLSHAVWEKYFHGDPRIMGRILQVAGQRAIVVGVLADDAWRLPGQMDAWLLEDQRSLAKFPSHAKGYVVANVKTSLWPPAKDGQWRMSVPDPSDGAGDYDCVSLAERSKQPLSSFFFALVLACFALPATTSLPLGEYSANCNHLDTFTKFRRWAFLGVKIGLVLVIVGFLSIDLAHLAPSINSLSAEYIQLGTSLCGFLLAFRWALRDQRKRCPKCLRLLTNPAHVGQSSRNFLAWNGTELICVGGHGLLHVPDMPTSWFSTQRWLYLDPSWSVLFSDAYLRTL